MLLRARTYVENGMTMPIPKRRKSFTFLVSAHVLSRLQSRQSDNEVRGALVHGPMGCAAVHCAVVGRECAR